MLRQDYCDTPYEALFILRSTVAHTRSQLCVAIASIQGTYKSIGLSKKNFGTFTNVILLSTDAINLPLLP